MRIEHICINARDIEKMKAFYVTYFGFQSNEKYHNDQTGWENYFLTAPDGGSRLELLSHADMPRQEKDPDASGWIHMAISLGSAEAVDHLAAQLKKDGYRIIGEPRQTGDGYYEAAVADPEGNMVEITI